MYCFLSPSSSLAWYITSFCSAQSLSRGHLSGFLQLHLFILFLVVGFVTFALCACMIVWMFLVHEYESFTVCLLINLWSLCFFGKCVSRRAKNLFPIFVVTVMLKGGLYHSMLRFFCFLFFLFLFSLSSSGFWYFRVYLNPLSSSAFWYVSFASSNSFALLDILLSLWLMAFGIPFITVGGWLLFTLMYLVVSLGFL